jgi:hypothetical protein
VYSLSSCDLLLYARVALVHHGNEHSCIDSCIRNPVTVERSHLVEELKPRVIIGHTSALFLRDDSLQFHDRGNFSESEGKSKSLRAAQKPAIIQSIKYHLISLAVTFFVV